MEKQSRSGLDPAGITQGSTFCTRNLSSELTFRETSFGVLFRLFTFVYAEPTWEAPPPLLF